MLASLAAQGIYAANMIFIGGGFCVGAIYHASLQSCAEAIVKSIQGDVRYQYFRELTPDEKAALDRDVEQSKEEYRSAKKANLANAMSEHGIFKGCHTMMGALSDDTKKEILSYLNAPTEAAWMNIRGYCIVGSTTLWQAWCAVDEKAPRSGSEGFPGSDMVRHAILEAVKSLQEELADAVN